MIATANMTKAATSVRNPAVEPISISIIHSAPKNKSPPMLTEMPVSENLYQQQSHRNKQHNEYNDCIHIITLLFVH